MTITELKSRLTQLGNDVMFDYKGYRSGITPTVCNGIFTFSLWYGDTTKDYTDFDELATDKIFNGKSLADIVNDLDLYFL